MNPYPKILISLVNWFKYDDTINCVKSIGELDYTNFEIAIVDNDSPNDSFAKLKEVLPSLHITKSLENDGYAAGHKINVDYATQNNFDAIWILNSDVKLRKNTLSELVEAWQANGNHLFGSVTLSQENPDIVDFGGGLHPSLCKNELSYNVYKGIDYSELPDASIREVQSLEGSSIFIPIEIIRKHGFMKTDFFMYGEETDYCLRLYKRGVKSYLVKTSVLTHKNASSFDNGKDFSWLTAYYRRRNFNRLVHEHFSIPHYKLFFENYNLIKTIIFLLQYVLRINKNKADYWTLIGTLHACICKKGKAINPNEIIIKNL